MDGAGERGAGAASPRHDHGGVLLRIGEDHDALGFVPADVARRLASLSSLTRVPGARPPVVGIALADGAVVTVLRLGDGHVETPARSTMGAPPAPQTPPA